METISVIANIPQCIANKIGKNLHQQKYHPIEIIKHHIYQYFGQDYEKFDDLHPQVSIEDNFDKLLIPLGHPARSISDTYYLNDKTILRTHTSAHQNDLLSRGFDKFLVTGDVYRKDEVDSHHYPVFHQMEGVCVLDSTSNADDNLKKILFGLVEFLFPGCSYRIADDYFPFTNPSYEIEVEYNGKWLEILGCGIIQPIILKNCGIDNKTAWAFGLGLERLAMILFNIPDIRYFWTDDTAFLNQFTSYKIIKFEPYPKLSPLTKDISFWIPNTNITENKWQLENDFFECCREIGGIMVEKVELFDTFYHANKQLHSRSYHIIYSCPDTTMNNPGHFTAMINGLHISLAKNIAEKLFVMIR